jgi:hypothetical protein
MPELATGAEFSVSAQPQWFLQSAQTNCLHRDLDGAAIAFSVS